MFTMEELRDDFTRQLIEFIMKGASDEELTKIARGVAQLIPDAERLVPVAKKMVRDWRKTNAG